MAYSLLFVFGLTIGSFLNVVSLRYAPDKFLFGAHIIRGRSRCLNCKKTLRWRELFPIASFLFQKGRCRSCGFRLSRQYPLIEFLAGVICAVVPFYFLEYKKINYLAWPLNGQPSALYLAAVLWAVVFLALLLLSVIDYRQYLVPHEFIYILLGLALIWAGLNGGSFLKPYADLFGFGNIFLSRLFGGFIGALAIGLIFFISKGKAIGFGDVKLMSALGLLFGWPDILLIFFWAFTIGAAWSLVLLARGIKTAKDVVPFAPFIAAASFLVFYLGSDMMRIYFNFFGL